MLYLSHQANGIGNAQPVPPRKAHAMDEYYATQATVTCECGARVTLCQGYTYNQDGAGRHVC